MLSRAVSGQTNVLINSQGQNSLSTGFSQSVIRVSNDVGLSGKTETLIGDSGALDALEATVKHAVKKGEEKWSDRAKRETGPSQGRRHHHAPPTAVECAKMKGLALVAGQRSRFADRLEQCKYLRKKQSKERNKEPDVRTPPPPPPPRITNEEYEKSGGHYFLRIGR